MVRYEKYKDSGIAWIGEVPEHWGVRRIKSFCIVKRGASPRPIDDEKYFDDNGEFAWVRIADASASERYLLSTTQKLSTLGASLSIKRFPDDIFLSIAGTVGKAIITKIKCCIHDGFVWFKNLNYNSELLYYIFESGQPYLGLGKMGTQLNLNTDTVGCIFVPYMNRAEQEQIVKYLDWKCGEVDRIVEVRERQIKLLGELRTSVISRAVTRGLNPNAPLKDSGIDWIGQIPEHWEICRLKNACSLKGRIGWKGLRSEEFEQISYAYLVTGQDFHSAIIDWTKCYQISKERYDEDPYIQLSNGDLLITKDGTIGKIAKVSNMDKPSCLNSGIFVMKQTKALFEQSYLYWLLESSLLKEFNNYTSTGTTILHLYQNVFENMPFIIPSLSEQQQIAEYLDKKTEEIDSTIDKFKVQIDKLKEYRQALIAEVVTGKIDIRSIEIPIPKSN
ncbi:restriction endonuclease subunit S [Candidatus Bacteroides intestinigallinarum]|jgi:type I restriction enzyme S subunit|uniref:restriction endonuclease subunit S n=1 Tax=Candidatus Bacteroides intestinigallinarum TaxID=2838470 RepID=UPI0022E4A276|nr:restriction endonuclease subunit S [Candidatus Bacteroides intestinigallinarum]